MGDQLAHQTRSSCPLCDFKGGESHVSSERPYKTSKAGWAVDGENSRACSARGLALCPRTFGVTLNSPDTRQIFTCWGSDCPKLLSPVSGVFVGSCLLGLVSCPFILPPWSLSGAPSALSRAHQPPALTAAAICSWVRSRDSSPLNTVLLNNALLFTPSTFNLLLRSTNICRTSHASRSWKPWAHSGLASQYLRAWRCFLVANTSRRPGLLFQLFVDSNAAGTEWSHRMFLKTISMGLALGCLRTEIIHPQVV